MGRQGSTWPAPLPGGQGQEQGWLLPAGTLPPLGHSPPHPERERSPSCWLWPLNPPPRRSSALPAPPRPSQAPPTPRPVPGPLVGSQASAHPLLRRPWGPWALKGLCNSWGVEMQTQTPPDSSRRAVQSHGGKSSLPRTQGLGARKWGVRNRPPPLSRSLFHFDPLVSTVWSFPTASLLRPGPAPPRGPAQRPRPAPEAPPRGPSPPLRPRPAAPPLVPSQAPGSVPTPTPLLQTWKLSPAPGPCRPSAPSPPPVTICWFLVPISCVPGIPLPATPSYLVSPPGVRKPLGRRRGGRRGK